MKKLLIFVAGYPKHSTTEAVLASFARLHYSVSLKFEAPKHKGKESHTVIEAKNSLQYQSILEDDRLCVAGRRLMCKPYLRGLSLYKKNALDNKRRVVVKRVPAQIPTSAVKEALEAVFGKVDLLFPFKPELESDCTSKRTHTSYSVMFLKIDAAAKAVQANNLSISEGVNADIQKFKNRSSNHKDRKRMPKIVHRPIPKKEIKMLDDNLTSIISERKGQEIKASKLDYKNQARSARHISLERYTEQYPDRKGKAFSVDKSLIKNLGYRRLELLEEICMTGSSFKPTSKLYRLIRSENFEFMATFELTNSWISISTLRHNLRAQFNVGTSLDHQKPVPSK